MLPSDSRWGPRRLVLMFCGLLPALFGLAGIIGWYARIPAFFKWSQIPMPYNAALSIAVCGLGVMAFALRRPRIAAAFSLVGMAVGAITLAEYAFAWNAGIDELFVRHWAPLGPYAPGRMAPNAALSTCVIAAAILLMCGKRFKRRPPLLGLCGSVVGALALAAVFGYVSGIPVYAWRDFLPMAVQVAVSFLLLGSGVVAFAFWDGQTIESGAPRWAPAVAVAAAMTITVCVWQALDEHHTEHDSAVTAAVAAHVEGELAAAVDARVSALVRLARRWERQGFLQAGQTEFEVRQIHQDYPGFQGIAQADSSMRVQWVVPLAGNQALVGANLAADERRRKALEAARMSRRPAFTAPIDLLVGGRGFHAIVPLFREDESAGFLVATFRASDFFDAVIARHLEPGYSVLVQSGGDELLRRPENASLEGRHEVRQIDWPGASWTVRVWPGRTPAGESLPEIVLVSGTLMALLTGLALRFAQTARLRRDIAERAERAVRARVAQQRAVAELGQEALAGLEVRDLLARAVRVVADSLEVEYAKILELHANEGSLRLVAGVGFREGLVGSATVPAGPESQAGYALAAGVPVIADDLRVETRFRGAPLLDEHGIVSGISVVISLPERAFGILGAYSSVRRGFSSDDVQFLQSIANIAATAIQRKRAADQLDQFFNLSRDMLCIAGADGFFKRLNQSWTETLGYSMEELTERPYVDFVHPDDRAPTVREGEGLAAGRSTISFENRYRARDGSYRRMLWNATPAPERGLVFAVARDVTDERRAAEELRRAHDELEIRVRERTADLENTNRVLEAEIEARRRLETERERFFTVSRDMFCVIDAEERFEVVNPAWERTLGYAPGELLGSRVTDLIHPDDLEASSEWRAQVFAGGEPPSFQNRLRSRDGDYHWLMWSASYMPDQRRSYAAARDITAIKQAEETLREREEQFRKLFEDSPIGACLAGLDMRLTRANRALCDMLGCGERDLLGLTFRDLTHPADLGVLAETVDRMGRGEIPTYRVDKRYLTRTGQTIWVDVTGTVIRREDGAPICYLAMMENITERKLRDEEIRKLNSELEQRVGELTALNKELEAFTYSVSHDLRAPLRHIDGFSKLVIEDYAAALDPQALRYLGRVREGSQQMGRMVDDLLNLARTGRREPAKVLTGLGALVEDVISELKQEAEGRDIEWRIGELPFADCDPDLIRHVFVNLLSNAVKFTGRRKLAVIEVGAVPSPAGTAIFVRDNGVGFSMKYADKLFGVFQRLHRREDFDGTGVGLATVQRIVHKHGGKVWAEAELDKGAAFFFTLEPPPASEPEAKLAASLKE